ncbi:MAG: hypothetical protein IJ165_02990 [Proteobacteria bacterium]|nr:hypothetical protein [Pseudomonadota bacterium]
MRRWFAKSELFSEHEHREQESEHACNQDDQEDKDDDLGLNMVVSIKVRKNWKPSISKRYLA